MRRRVLWQISTPNSGYTLKKEEAISPNSNLHSHLLKVSKVTMAQPVNSTHMATDNFEVRSVAHTNFSSPHDISQRI